LHPRNGGWAAANPWVCNAAVRRAAVRAGRGAAVSRGAAATAATAAGAGTAATAAGTAATVTAIVTADDPQTQERKL
jgi:hypothetical protein